MALFRAVCSISKRSFFRGRAFQSSIFPNVGREQGDLEKELNLSIDWRSYFGPVKDQGSSGGCLPISVAEAVGVAHRIATGEKVELSPQYIMDSIPEDAFSYEKPIMEFIRRNGLPLEVDYPARDNYQIKPPKLLKQDARRIFIRGYEAIPPHMASDALLEGPLLVAMSTGKSYSTYDGSGIIFGEDEDRMQAVLHSQLLVGEGYFRSYPVSLVRGTYGYDWGLGGYACLYLDPRGGRGVYGLYETMTRVIV